MACVRKNVSIPKEMDEWVKEGHRSPSKILQYRIREMMNEEKEREKAKVNDD